MIVGGRGIMRGFPRRRLVEDKTAEQALGQCFMGMVLFSVRYRRNGSRPRSAKPRHPFWNAGAFVW
jgi:hypothetical protein